MRSISIATWNIGSLYKDYERILDYIGSLLESQSADILCVQECPDNDEVFNVISSRGGFDEMLFRVTSESHVGEAHNMGTAVFSRTPLLLFEQLPLKKPEVEVEYNGAREYWHDKCFFSVGCKFGDTELTVVTGHGFPFHRYGLENEESADIIKPSFAALDGWMSGIAEAQSNRFVCSAADFNLNSPLKYMPLCRDAFYDIFEGESTRPSGRKTDAILVPKGTEVEFKVNIVPPAEESVGEARAQGMLDHNYISAKILLP